MTPSGPSTWSRVHAVAVHHATMLTVGAFSRASGLPVSALRYYDAAGVLRPAHVDPVTGYRWYTPDQVGRAGLVARIDRKSVV